MATDTVPAAPGPATPDPSTDGGTTLPGSPATPVGGWLANALAPVDPARPAFNLTPTTGDSDPAAGTDGLLDRSAPGVSSASFRGAADSASGAGDPAGKNHKRSVWKELWLAAATRWAKGGGTANKRLDLAKARAQAKAYQVKENRTTTAVKSGGLPVRNTGGSGAGGAAKNNSGKSGGDSARKGPVNSSGSGAGGSGRSGSGGSGGGRGSGGGTGGKRPGPAGRATKDTAASGKGGAGSAGPSGGMFGKDKTSVAPKKTDTHGPASKGLGKHTGGGGGAGKPGPAGKPGKDGPSGTGGKTSTGPGAKGPTAKTDLTKDPKGHKGKDHAPGPAGHKTSGKSGAEKTPLEKSREIGHGDGTKARRVVDHVKAYVDGTRDGWSDEKHGNAKEHARLDKAHTDHKKTKPDHKTDKPATTTGPAIVTDKGDDGVSTDVKPLLVKDIDTHTITLGTADARGTVSRKELRNFKQYERKLEAKETVLHKIADACKVLEKQAEQEAKECQDLAEQAKSVKGGEKLGVTLAKLAEAAKNQAMEAAELARRATRAAEMCKVVLTNIQTRYAPLYKAVVDSDETKPAELRFYNDKGSYAPAA